MFQAGLDSTRPPAATGKVLVAVQSECFMASGLLFADCIAMIISVSVFNTDCTTSAKEQDETQPGRESPLSPRAGSSLHVHYVKSPEPDPGPSAHRD